MKNIYLLLLTCFTFISSYSQPGLNVVTTHPRVMLDAATRTSLINKKASNAPEWLALLAEANNYAARPVLSWNVNNASVWNTNYIFYSYCGSSWEDATMSLAMAHQITKGINTGSFPTTYSNKLLQLADSIIAAYNAFPPCNQCPNIFLFNSSYALRHVGPTVAVIYDWCYDELGATRKAQLRALMENWFNYMRVPFRTYQNESHATGNYYFGNVLCASMMGYALMYDSPLAQVMIDYARQRVLGTQSGALLASDICTHFIKETYTGNTPTSSSSSYLGPANYTTAPQKSGYQMQGWSYGTETLNRLMDYCFTVKTATGEQIADSMMSYFTNIFHAHINALTPNRWQVDNSTDWGSFIGNVMSYGFPLRLSSLLAGTPAGPNAQYYYKNWIQPVNFSAAWNHGYPELNWELMLYKDNTRPTSPFSMKPYYPIPDDSTRISVQINKDHPRFYMRHDWNTNSILAVANMGCAWHDDHQHHSAGHFQIVRGDSHDGDDLLLVSADEVGNGGSFGMNGIQGGSAYHDASSHANTLFFNDFGDYMALSSNGRNQGGQYDYGNNDPTALEQADSFSYFRSDLSSAYNRKGQLSDTVNRKLDYFYRSFLYLRNADMFITYDKFQAKNSTNTLGQYKKHIRWHFLEMPTVNGNNITAMMDNSKLFIHTILPATAAINIVDESNNPDNVWGNSLNYGFNTYTWRAEVNQPNNPLTQKFLTVLQPGALANTEMTTTSISTANGNMDGTIITGNGFMNLVFFNNNPGKYPTPISAASYYYNGDCNTVHTLCGVAPNTMYYVSYKNDSVKITPSANGNVKSSNAGVLRYKVFLPQITGTNNACLNKSYTYSVPPISGSIYTWTVTGGVITAGTRTNTITVLWNSGTVGTVSVEQIRQ